MCFDCCYCWLMILLEIIRRYFIDIFYAGTFSDHWKYLLWQSWYIGPSMWYGIVVWCSVMIWCDDILLMMLMMMTVFDVIHCLLIVLLDTWFYSLLLPDAMYEIIWYIIDGDDIDVVIPLLLLMYCIYMMRCYAFWFHLFCHCYWWHDTILCSFIGILLLLLWWYWRWCILLLMTFIVLRIFDGILYGDDLLFLLPCIPCQP